VNWSKTTLPDGVALLAFSLFLTVGATQVSLKNWNDLGISPRAFPYFLAACIGFMGIMLVIGGLRQRKKAGSPSPHETPDEKPGRIVIPLGARKLSVPPTLFIAVLAILYIYLWKPIGFLIVTPVFMWISLMAFGSKPKKSLLITIGVVAAIYLAFTYGFKVTLPAGLLRGIL
jgi:putative tricarboxylic transport membrane protein